MSFIACHSFVPLLKYIKKKGFKSLNILKAIDNSEWWAHQKAVDFVLEHIVCLLWRVCILVHMNLVWVLAVQSIFCSMLPRLSYCQNIPHMTQCLMTNIWSRPQRILDGGIKTILPDMIVMLLISVLSRLVATWRLPASAMVSTAPQPLVINSHGYHGFHGVSTSYGSSSFFGSSGSHDFHSSNDFFSFHSSSGSHGFTGYTGTRGIWPGSSLDATHCSSHGALQ